MSVLIPSVFVLSSFFLAAWAIFGGLISATDDQTESLRVANQLYEERVRTNISISCTAGATGDYTMAVDNLSRGVSVSDFPNVDLITRYTSSTGGIVSRRLVHSTDWSVTSISGDSTDTVWDPGESVLLSFTLSPVPQTGSSGGLAIGVLGGVVDFSYFGASVGGAC